MTSVVVDRVSHRYGRGANVIEDVSLELPSGAVMGLLGANGAGKTTLLKCVAGLLAPSTGEVRVGGIPSRGRTCIVNGTLSFVSDAIRLPRELTLSSLHRWIAPFHSQWDWDLAASLVASFQLDAARRIASYSRGQYLKAALSCALAARPRVLVLDEPFAGVDVVTRDTVLRGILAQASLSGATVVLASHDLGEIETVLSHVGVLAGKRLRVFSTTEHLAERFLRITVVGNDIMLRTLAEEQPWLGVQRAGRVLRITLDAERTPVDLAMLERRFPDADALQVEPLGLRDIFAVTLGDSAREIAMPEIV